MSELTWKYNKSDRRDVLRHAKDLEGYTIGDVYNIEVEGRKRCDILERYAEIHLTGGILPDGSFIKQDKGRIGNLVQEIYFDIPLDHEPEYDIRECKVELKTSKLVNMKRKGLAVKERLILGMINSADILPEKFEDSHVYKKCKLIMLVYYINQEDEGKKPFEFPFYKSAYMMIPPTDMQQIRKDYEYIRKCVNEGRYDDLHESEAKYLSPAPKNGNRAFSFKVSYMNQIFKEYINANRIMYDPETDEETFEIINEYESLIMNPNELAERSLEDIVLEKFNQYIDMTMFEIRQELMGEEFNQWLSDRKEKLDGGKENIDKAELARTTFMMLGINGEQAEEFIKANVYVKTLKVNQDGSMNEDISFPAFEFSDLMEEEWKESQAYSDMVDREFLWAVFQETSEGFVFRGAKFWSMPGCDEEIIKQGWDDIRLIIRNGVRFAKDVRKDGNFVVTSRGHNRILNSFPDSKNTVSTRKEHRLCPAGAALNRIISIRPHTQQVYYDLKSIGYRDTSNPSYNGSELPNGDIMTKQCFWFNNSYILEQVQDLISQ